MAIYGSQKKGSDRALILFDEKGNISSWTYHKLQLCVNALSLELKLKAHQVVAIALPFGIEYAVAVLAAMKLGLVIAPLPPSTFTPLKKIQKCVDEIHPDLLITNHALQAMGLSYPSLFLLDELKESTQEVLSYEYALDEIFQLSLSLSSRNPYTITNLTASRNQLNAFTENLQLKPGVVWAAPLSCPIAFQPFSLFATLLSGATYLHIPDALLRNEPTILKNEKIHAIGISSALLDVWSELPSCPSRVKIFFTPYLDRRVEKWKRFVQLNKLKKTPSFQAWIDNSLGGAILTSQPTWPILSSYAKPTGDWFLQDPLSEKKSQDFGFFGHSNHLFAHIDQSLLFSGSEQPCRGGVTIPIKSIETLVTKCEGVEACVLFAAPRVGNTLDYQITLLVFMDPFLGEDPTTLTQEIQRRIAEEISRSFTADQIEYFPFLPKMQNGEPDRSWCIQHFKSGTLTKHKKMQTLRLCSQLRKLLHHEQNSKDH